MWTREKSALLSSIITKAAIVAITVCCIFAPYMVSTYDAFQVNVLGIDSVFWPLIICLYITAVFGFVILISLDKLLLNIKKRNVFIETNVKILRVLSYCCFGISLVFIGLGFYKTMAFIIVIIAAFFGLIIRVVKNIFEQAIEIREENDYTI